MRVTEFERELSSLLNRYSVENTSNTPDFILAEFMLRCLNAFDTGISDRERWYGHRHAPGGVCEPIVSLAARTEASKEEP